jgi:hypothetical protein
MEAKSDLFSNLGTAFARFKTNNLKEFFNGQKFNINTEVKMKLLSRMSLLFCLIVLALQIGCSDDPASSMPTSGSIKITLKSTGSGVFSKVLGNTINQLNITSAQVVIEEIEFESTVGDSFDFKLKVPFIQDLMLGSNTHEIETIQIPFGSYKESEIEIDDLDSTHGQVYTQNPELQDNSILVKGYLNNNPNETFVFSSDLEEEQEKEFKAPLILDENSPSTNIVLVINMDSWFVDSNGDLVDPNLAGNKSKIEGNIKNSIDVFEDSDGDGEEDD